MTAAALAVELEVSERTIFRDIDALSGAGVPVYAVRGAQGGFELLAGFDEQLPVPGGRGVGGPGGIRATVRVSPQGRRLLSLAGRPVGLSVRRVTVDEVGWVTGTARFESADAAVGEVLAMAGELEVVRPVALRARVRDAATRVVAVHYAVP